MSKPKFFIIAGPNGAGKSTSSKEILKQYGIEAFDWDAEFYNLWSRFSYDPAVEKGVKDRTTELFNEHLDKALEEGRNVAYETNFHIDYHFRREQQAKEKGFETVLYFFFVENTDVCNERVQLRHELGGHFVDVKTIEHRWKEGLNRLNKALLSFDQVLIFDTTEDYNINFIAAIWKKELNTFTSSKIGYIRTLLPTLNSMLIPFEPLNS